MPFASIVIRHYFNHSLGNVTPTAYDFSGNAVTFLGLIGVISTGIIMMTVFRRYFNSELK